MKNLPEGWVETTLSELCVLNPKHAKEIKDSTEISFIPMANVSGTLGEISSSEVRLLGEVRKGYTHFAENDIIWAKITPCMENGKSAIAKSLHNGLACGSTEFYVLRPNGAVISEFLHQYLRQESYRKEAKMLMSGAVGQQRVPKDFLLNSTLFLPPFSEQKRIARKIESLQSRSAKARKALEAIPSLLEKFRQSVLSSAFRGDLTADWRAENPDIEPAEKLLERIRKERRKRWEEDELAKMKAKGKEPKDDKWKKKYKEPEPVDSTDLPALPEGWCWASIDQVTFLVTKGASPRWQGFEYCKEGIPFVRSQNIGWGHLLLGNIEYVAEGLNDKQPRSIIQKGDVLLNIVGASIGRAAISEEEIAGGNCNQAVAIIRLIPKGLDPTTLMNFLISPDAQKVIHDGKVDVARANYSLDDIKNMAVPVPPENEQKFIEEKLRKLIAFSKAAIAKCNDAKDRCKLLDQSILAKAFRGELVPQDPNDEPASQLLKRIKQEKASRETGKEKRARKGPTAKRL